MGFSANTINSRSQGCVKALISIIAIVSLVLPLTAKAYGRMFDGGMLLGIEEKCTCSGGTNINTMSYVDNSYHVYLYQPGVTQLYPNYNIMSSDAYFLTTLTPVAICLVYQGEDCGDSAQNPEGVFRLIGTSFNNGKNSFATLFDSLPGSSLISNTASRLTPTFSWKGP